MLGLSGALMAMVREQDVFFAARAGARFRHRAGAAANAGAAIGKARRWARRRSRLCFLPQLVAYMRLNGHPAPSRLVTRKMTWTAPHALEVLFSPAHGFFFWTPLAVLAIAGLVVPGDSPSAGSPPPGGPDAAHGRAAGLRRRERRVVDGRRRVRSAAVRRADGPPGDRAGGCLGGQSQRRAAFGPHWRSSCCASGGTWR